MNPEYKLLTLFSVSKITSRQSKNLFTRKSSIFFRDPDRRLRGRAQGTSIVKKNLTELGVYSYVFGAHRTDFANQIPLGGPHLEKRWFSHNSRPL